MSIQFKTVATAAALAIALGTASAVYAASEQNSPPQSAPTAPGMLGNGQMTGLNGGMGGMMRMMNMMGQMSQMMGYCNQMMQSRMQPPNSQWQKPGQPGEKG